MIDISKFTEAICDLGITPNQFYILYCLSLGNKGYGLIFKMMNEVTEWSFSERELQSLIDRGFVINTGKEMRVDEFIITDKFKDAFLSEDKMEAADEAWEAFPSFIKLSNGCTGVTKSNVSEEEWKTRYAEEIGQFKGIHQKVLEAIAWGKNNGKVNYRIADFFRYYNDLLQIHWESMNRELLAGQEEVK